VACLSVNIDNLTMRKTRPTRAVDRGLEKCFVIRYADVEPDDVHYPKYVYLHDVSWLALLTTSGN
jgi:hypothetical protein